MVGVTANHRQLFSMTGPVVAVLSAVLSWILVTKLAPAFQSAGVELPALTAWWLEYHYLGWLVPIATALTWWRLSRHPSRAGITNAVGVAGALLLTVVGIFALYLPIIGMAGAI